LQIVNPPTGKSLCFLLEAQNIYAVYSRIKLALFFRGFPGSREILAILQGRTLQGVGGPFILGHTLVF
jgi:hypothetical protein